MKILVFAGFSGSLLQFRKDLLIAMIKEGHSVIAIGPETGVEEELNNIGVRFLQIKCNRLKTNPIEDIGLLIRLIKIMRKEKPEVFFGYTIKPVIYGSIAAFLTGIKKRYVMVTGLGSVFIEEKMRFNLVRAIIKVLYRIGFSCATKVFFQNQDDIKDMTNMRLIKKDKVCLVNGSGVNLAYYAPSPLPKEDTFLFVGSLLRNKGICEYMEAASIVKKTYPEVQCLIVGPIDQRISSITEADLKCYLEAGSICYLGPTSDVRPYLDQCRYFVLPSYREGTPRSVLEAMAKGRPVITTDAPGCRETVIDGQNGFLVQIRDSKGLAEKMLWMIEHPEAVERMAQSSLSLVKEKFDVNKINQFMLKEMNLTA